MKIILLQDVAKIGRRQDIVEVPDGYAMNQLIPKRMAEAATPANIKRLEKMSKDKAVAVAADADSFKTAVEALKSTTPVITAEANEQGHLFKAVSADDVVAAAKTAGADIAADMVVFAEPVKEIGEQEITLKHADSEVTVTISVVANS